MKPLFCVSGIFVLLFGLAGAGQICRSGNYVVETDQRSGMSTIYNAMGAPIKVLADTVEQLVNGGFETGSLPPWYTDMWQVTSIDSHTGQYCAADTGNYYIRQDFSPISTDSIISITFWSRQPENALQAFDFIYDDNTFDENPVFPTSTWQMFDVTSYLPAGRIMIGLRLWGYWGAGAAPDSTYSDDISIQVVTQGAVEENKRADRQLAFNISPNPVRGNAVIEYAAGSSNKTVLSIYDINGALMERMNLENGRYTWSTKELETGVYFARLDTGTGQSAVRKITVISK